MWTLVQINYKPGTQEEAQLLAMGVNAGHGLQRNNATKRKVVEAALAHPSLQGASNVHIAKLCKVSDTFVAAVRNPEMKKKQAEKVAKHYKEKLGSTEVLVMLLQTYHRSVQPRHHPSTVQRRTPRSCWPTRWPPKLTAS